MTDQPAPSNDETLMQVDFTTEELTALLRLLGASLPQFQQLDLSVEAREAALRALYARGVITADTEGNFSVNSGAALLATAGVQARSIVQLDRPSQQLRDIVYVLDGFVVRQSEAIPGVQRFQILDTPFKLVALFSAALNINPDQNNAPIGTPFTVTRADWQRLREGGIAAGAPESLWRALNVPQVVVGMTAVVILDGQPQAPNDALFLGHPEGGYWAISFNGDTVQAAPVDSVGAVQTMVNLLGG